MGQLDPALLDEHIRRREALTASGAAGRRSPRAVRRVVLIAACVALFAALTTVGVIAARRAGDDRPGDGTTDGQTSGTLEPYSGVTELETSDGRDIRKFSDLALPGSLADCALAQVVLPVVPDVPVYYAPVEEWDVYSAYAIERRAHYGSGVSLTDFFADISRVYLSGTAGGENRVLAPLNVYYALAMLAETTAGDTQAEILRLLKADGIGALRKRSADLWISNFSDDCSVTHVTSSSLWLSRDYTYKKETLERLRDCYYASTYAGQMGSADYDSRIRDWVDYSTGGLLKDASGRITTNPNDVVRLYSATYLHAGWSGLHPEKQAGVFRAPDGDADCTMLYVHQSCGHVLEGTHFLAAELPLAGGYTVSLVLPDEDVGIEGLLSDRGDMSLALRGSNDPAIRPNVELHCTFPTFDIASGIDLVDGLKTLGVGKCFEGGDFSALTEDAGGIYVERVDHAARLSVTEDGVTAGAVTTVSEAMEAEAMGVVHMTLDCPFLCVVRSEDSIPVFVGVINHP